MFSKISPWIWKRAHNIKNCCGDLRLQFSKVWTHKIWFQISNHLLKFFKINSPNTSQGFPRALVKCPNNCHLKSVTTKFKVGTRKFWILNLVFAKFIKNDFIGTLQGFHPCPIFQNIHFCTFDLGWEINLSSQKSIYIKKKKKKRPYMVPAWMWARYPNT